MSKKQYWLMKSEPDVFSIDDLKRDGKAHWDGVRNYQARNFMRDQMKIGDEVLFYHSNAEPPGVAGVAQVASQAYPDFTQWDAKSEYFDPRASKEKPVWMMVDIKYKKKFKRIVALEELRQAKSLEGLMVIRRGMRLSIQPVEATHFSAIVKMGSGS